MEQCPLCRNMTAEVSPNGELLICYRRGCGYECSTNKIDDGILYNGYKVPRSEVKKLDRKFNSELTVSEGGRVTCMSLGKVCKEESLYINCTFCDKLFRVSPYSLNGREILNCPFCTRKLKLVYEGEDNG